MNDQQPAVMDAEAAAAFLGVHYKTLIRWAREGKLPSRKVGREWRFSRQALLDFLDNLDQPS